MKTGNLGFVYKEFYMIQPSEKYLFPKIIDFGKVVGSIREVEV